MNFNVIEGEYADLDAIKEDFIQDYLLSFDMSNKEIRNKYGLTWKEFKELSEEVKSEFGYTRRPKKPMEGKYYYQTTSGFIIQKRINGESEYLGFVTSKELAEKCVELCKQVSWNVSECRHIIKHWRKYLC